MAVLRPQLEIFAVERNPEWATFIRANRERFDTYNLCLVEGTAPEALERLDQRPRFVFIGGSGTRLGEVLDVVAERLVEGGRLLANFVTLEHLATMLQRLHAWAWPFQVTNLHISRSDDLGGCTGLRPQREVFLVHVDKPGGGS